MSLPTPPPRPSAYDLDVVIPAYNEAQRLPRSLATLAEALRGRPETALVTVVDNCSSDATRAVAEQFAAHESRCDVRVLSCEEKGKGAAVRRGVLATPARWVGFMDADLATSLDALPATLDHLASGTPVVIGTRRHDMSHLLIEHDSVRRAGGWAFRALVARIVPGLADTQCGFKFFDAVVAQQLFAELVSTGWAFDVEVLARAQAVGLAVAEVPVRWTNQPGSRFSPARDGVATLRELARIRTAVRRTTDTRVRPVADPVQ